MSFGTAENARARRDFPALNQDGAGPPLAFLDGPGGTQVPQAVIDAIDAVYRTCNVNTHGKFPPSRRVDALMDEARAAVAEFLGAADGSSISFGQNMTSLNFALSAAIGRGLEAGDEILITQLDHEANRSPWSRLVERGVVVREVRLLASGELDTGNLAELLGPRTKLLAIGGSSNALGTVNDLALARRLTHAVGALLVVDAVHYAPHFPIDVRALGVDFLLCSAYKFYGPHVGILYSAPGALARLATDRLSTQDPAPPYRIETGTLNHAAIAGVRAAIDFIATWGEGTGLRERLVTAMSGIGAYEHELARYLHGALAALPGVRIWGPGFSNRARAPTVSITLERHTPGEAAAALGEQGLCVWDGDFYAARAVEVLGLSGRGGLLRTGISLYTPRAEIDRLLAGIQRLAG